MKRLNLSGKRYGKLVVISYSHSHIQPSGQKRAMWNVVCDCGTIKKVSTANLISKNTTSCGCVLRENLKKGNNKKEEGVADLNYKYLSYKSRAKRKKPPLEFFLSKEDFRNIILKDCHYCGAKISPSYTRRRYNGIFSSNGIDRINSLKGYILENCLACCALCNMMKNNLEYDNFINHVKRINEYASTKR